MPAHQQHLAILAAHAVFEHGRLVDPGAARAGRQALGQGRAQLPLGFLVHHEVGDPVAAEPPGRREAQQATASLIEQGDFAAVADRQQGGLHGLDVGLDPVVGAVQAGAALLDPQHHAVDRVG